MSYTSTGTLITQSGTDTSLGAPPFTSLGTFAGQTYYSTGGKSLTITGSLTIPHNQCLVIRDNLLTIDGNGTLTLKGTHVLDGNTHAYGAVQLVHARDSSSSGWASEKVQLTGGTTAPAKFFVQDTTVFINGPKGRGFWAKGPNDLVSTQGAYAVILTAHNDVSQFRVDSPGTHGMIDTQAKNTYLGVAPILNQNPVKFNPQIFGVYSVAVTTDDTPSGGATPVELYDFDTSALSFVISNRADVSSLFGAILNLINCEQGTNLRVRHAIRGTSYSGVVNVVRQVAITLQEGVTALDDIVVGWEYTRVYKAGIRPFQATSDYAYFSDTKQRETAGAGNTGCTVSVLLGVCESKVDVGASTSFETYVSGTLKGSETHTLYTGKYGYKKLATSCTLAGTKTLEKQLTVEKVPTTRTSANAAGLSHIRLDFATTTIAITASGTTGGGLTETTWGDVYDRIQYLLYTKDYIAKPDFTSVAGDTIDLGSWDITIDNELLKEGTKVKGIRTQGNITLTNGGKYTGKVESADGVCVTLVSNKTDTSFYAMGSISPYTKYLYEASAERVGFVVPKGTAVTVCAYARNTYSKTFTVDTSKGAKVIPLTLSSNDSIKAVNTDTYYNSIVCTYDTSNTANEGELHVSFNSAMEVPSDDGSIYALLDRIMRTEPALRMECVYLPIKTEMAMEITSNGVIVRAPYIRFIKGSSVTAQQRVNLETYFSTIEAREIDPTYIINPKRADSTYVEVHTNNGSLDPLEFAKRVWKEATMVHDIHKRLALKINTPVTNSKDGTVTVDNITLENTTSQQTPPVTGGVVQERK
ncbi:hypothetical protein [Thiolapillus sp.]|uniref:hypothetical protein n=2 Tax=Thiolapillus sp. TaxID=2017437 RepID=UPI003AF7F561